MSASRELGAFIVGLQFRDLPDEVVKKAKGVLIDFLGVALVGSRRPHVRRMADALLNEMSGMGCTVVGDRRAATNLSAAFLNGLAGSSAPQLDDVWKESLGHPGVGTIPAALAVGESHHRSGQELIVAVVAGYEVAMRVGSAVGWTGLDRGWHPRGGLNAFAAAAAATRLMNPRAEDAAVAALGHAGNAAGGLTGAAHFHDAWYVLSANASWNGVMAALLASQGLDAGEGILDGAYGGYVPTVSAQPDLDALTKGLGQELRILRVGQKLYPSSAATHAAIEAAITIHRTSEFSPSDIEHVVVRGFHTMAGRLGVAQPRSLVHAGMSVPFLVATALVCGVVDLGAVESHTAPPEAVREVQMITRIETDPQLDAAYPKKLGAEVEVRLTDGRLIQRRVEVAAGDADRPLTRDQLIGKFRSLVGPIIGDQSALDLLRGVADLENSVDVTTLLQPLSWAGAINQGSA